jgi:transcriptional regulator with XRE-family HTH domain
MEVVKENEIQAENAVPRTWLVELRIKKDLTQQQVADLTGLNRSMYCHIETGTRNATVPVAKKLGKFYGFDWTIFFNL